MLVSILPVDHKVQDYRVLLLVNYIHLHGLSDQEFLLLSDDFFRKK